MAETSLTASPFAIQPPKPTTRENLIAAYGLCFECGEPRRQFALWTHTADGKPDMRIDLRCGCDE
jgi:hypothetical protein